MVDPFHEIVVNTHVHRSRLTYKEYFDQKTTRPLADYFFESIYTLEGKHERDEMAVNMYNRFKSMLSEKSRGRIENLLLLNEITDRLDRQMADALRKDKKLIVKSDGVPHIDLKKLPQIYRKTSTLDDRVAQLRLVVQNLESFFELSKHPMAGVVIRPVALAAKTVGFSKIFKVFEQGYNATKPISKEVFFEFTQYVRGHEMLFLEKSFKQHVHLL